MDVEFEILEESKNKIKILFKKETHTLPNLLRKKLWEDEDVVVAGYKLIHPLKEEVEFYLETKSKPAREVLINTLQKILKEIDEFKKEYEKALKEYGS